MILISLDTEVSNERLKESILAEKHQDYDDFPKSCLSGLVALLRPQPSKKVQIICTFKKFQTWAQLFSFVSMSLSILVPEILGGGKYAPPHAISALLEPMMIGVKCKKVAPIS